MPQSDYGRAGLIGMLVPQANTTVEPEMWALMPPGWSMVAARLTSGAGTIEDRLRDYAGRFVETSEQFANAPLTALGVGCTGTSYLIGAEADEALAAEMSARRGVPCWTAAQASVAALEALGARRIGLVSPYPGALDAACTPYWEGRGFTVAAKAGPALREDRFHPIYGMEGEAVIAAAREVAEACDAVLMLGTGMATLAAIAALRGGPPVLSCNLALIWALTESGAGRAPGRAALERWIAAEDWAPRLGAMFPAD